MITAKNKHGKLISFSCTESDSTLQTAMDYSEYIEEDWVVMFKPASMGFTQGLLPIEVEMFKEKLIELGFEIQESILPDYPDWMESMKLEVSKVKPQIHYDNPKQFGMKKMGINHNRNFKRKR